MEQLRRRSQLIGAMSIVAAIVAGAALPVILNAGGTASSFTLTRASVAACSTPQISGSEAPVANASLPCTPKMTARPDTGLLDGQSVTVTGSGFPPSDFIPLIECQSFATRDSQCEFELEGFAQTDQTGAFSTSMNVARLLETGTTTIDCAQRQACEIAAANEEADTIEASTPVTFKDVPLPTLAVTPATDLSDGQNVTVTGANFDPGSTVTFTECPLGQADFLYGCDSDTTGQAMAGPTGTFTTTYSVARILTTNGGLGGGTVDCAVAPGCVLAALGNVDNDIEALTPLSFNPRVPPLPPLSLTMSLKPKGQVEANGGAELFATLSCTAKQPVDVSVDVNLTETADSELADSSITTQETCVKTPAPVTLTLPDQSVPFSGGVGEVTLEISARDGSAVTQQVLSGSVALTVPAHEPPPVYYVALGDSLAAGFASPPGQGYANDLLADLQKTTPDLQLVDLGCSSETTTTLIQGGICTYPAGSQLAAATAFLAAHRGSVALVTIDIGGNDYLGCFDSNPPSDNAKCIQTTGELVKTNLTSIMSQLRTAAGSSVPFLGMNYFDPFLDYWPDGSTGKAVAKGSVTVIGTVNSLISSVYTAVQAPVADVEGAFETTDLHTKVETSFGRVPVAVDNTCMWLDFTCAKGLGGFGDDTVAAGSAVIAGAFEKVLPTNLSDPAQR
jgi:lysophospholipase L1-like esterase